MRTRGALAIDLYCGLGGWTEGLLSEGWIWYDWIWPTKLVRSLKDSGKRSISPPANAGYGWLQGSVSVTGNSPSQKVARSSAPIVLLTRSVPAPFLTACKSYIGVMCRRASTRRIFSWVRKATTFKTCEPRGDGITGREIRAARTIQTQFSLMLRSRACWQTSPTAGGL